MFSLKKPTGSHYLLSHLLTFPANRAKPGSVKLMQRDKADSWGISHRLSFLEENTVFSIKDWLTWWSRAYGFGDKHSNGTFNTIMSNCSLFNLKWLTESGPQQGRRSDLQTGFTSAAEQAELRVLPTTTTTTTTTTKVHIVMKVPAWSYYTIIEPSSEASQVCSLCLTPLTFRFSRPQEHLGVNGLYTHTVR